MNDKNQPLIIALMVIMGMIFLLGYSIARYKTYVEYGSRVDKLEYVLARCMIRLN